MDPAPDWIAVDWGTSRLRAWAMRGSTVLAEADSDDGVGRLAKSEFEPALLRLVTPWLGSEPIPALCCGMVGSRQGWVEAPYRAVPAKPLDSPAIQVPKTGPHLQAFVLPGLKQTAPADVMRGEETQIAGFMALNPKWDGVICLPGTHTKWAQVSAGEVVNFQTFMTGELFALLQSQSVLHHSIAADGWDATAFAEAVSDALSRPEAMAAHLFSLRAKDLLEGAAPETARTRLSGLLIGAELAAAHPYWIGQQIAIVGSDSAAKPYADALEIQGSPTTIADAPRMTLAGFTAAYRALKETA